MYTKQVFT